MGSTTASSPYSKSMVSRDMNSGKKSVGQGVSSEWPGKRSLQAWQLSRPGGGQDASSGEPSGTVVSGRSSSVAVCVRLSAVYRVAGAGDMNRKEQ